MPVTIHKQCFSKIVRFMETIINASQVEDTPSTERPQDTLADEEEYERQQEALRKEKEEASQGSK